MRVRAESVGSTERNYRRLVTGRMNLAVNFVAIEIFAVITRGGHDHNTGVNQRAGCATHWIVSIRADRWSAQTHISEANAVFVLVQRFKRGDKEHRISRMEDPLQHVKQRCRR